MARTPRRLPAQSGDFAPSVIDSIQDAIVVTDLHLDVLSWNSAMETLTGIPRAEALGRPLETVLPFLRAAGLHECWLRALAGETVERSEVAYTLAAGPGDGWLDTRCVPWRDGQGEVGGVAAFLTDVTARRRRTLFVRALEAIGHSLTSSLDLNEVLDTIVTKALEVMGAESAIVVSWDGHATELRVMRAAGRLSAEYVAAGSIAVGWGPMSRAVLERRSIQTKNLAADPEMRLSPERHAQVVREGFKAVAAAPLASKGAVHGALVVHHWTERSFADEEMAALERLGEQAALAIDNAQLYADATRRAERLRGLADFERRITASLDLDAVLHTVALAGAAMAPGALAAVHVFDPERDLLTISAMSSDETEGLPRERSARAGLPGLVAQQRSAILVEDPINDPRTLAPDWWARHPGATYYGVPILAGETFMGVLDYILPAGAPDAEAQELLRLLAAHAGLAMRNASLYQSERAHAARIGTLALANQRISGALDLDALLKSIAASAAQLTGVRFASFWLADPARRTLTLTRGSVAEIAGDFPQPVITYEQGGVGWIATHRRPLQIDDVFDDARIANTEWWRRWGLRAFLGYPVVAGDELSAVLVLSHTEPMAFPPATRDVLDMFVAQAGVAIQNARLYQEAQRRRDVAEALARLGRDLTETLDAQRTGEIVTRGVVELLAARASVLYRYQAEDGTLHAIAWYGANAEKVRGLVLKPGEGATGRAVAERKMVMSTRLWDDPDLHVTPGTRERFVAVGYPVSVAVPLLTHERIVGGLVVAVEAGREFTEEELESLQMLADRAVLALENARLYTTARESLALFRHSQAQLIQAGKMSALGQLVSGVAHELNNPLSVIIGYGQLLLGRAVTPEIKRPVELMVAQGERMAKIVRNLLLFARQRKPERTGVDLNEIVEQTLALRLHQMTLSGIAVEKDFAPALPTVAGDTQQLQQVILNLILNAEQAIAAGHREGRVVFRTRPLPHDGGVRVQIVDDGPGIPAETLPRIFEPFFTTKEVGEGTGLGLSVSYGIAEEHGGRLYAESEPGRTVFTLELPVGVIQRTGEAAPAAPPRVSFAGRTALIVDDEPALVDLVSTLLEQGGWSVDVAPDGQAGIASVRGRRYDLIVSDMRMPHGSGEDFFREAVAHDASIARRFIFITGDTANPGAWAFARQAGVPVIEKPFESVLFQDTVRRVALGVTPAP